MGEHGEAVLQEGPGSEEALGMEGSDTRKATAGSLKPPWSQDPSKNTVKTHIHPRDAGTPERDPQTHTNDTHDTDLGHHPETQAHARTHTIPQIPHNRWTSLERQTQGPIHIPATLPKAQTTGPHKQRSTHSR